jgi:MscS family membrane protein
MNSSWVYDVIFLLPNWKWLVLVAAFLLGRIFKSFLKKLFVQLSGQLQNRAKGFALYFLRTDLQTPLSWIFVSLFWQASLDLLMLGGGLDKYLRIGIQLFLSYQIIVLVYRAADAFGSVLKDLTAKTDNTLDDELAPLATKTLKVFVVIFGFLIVLQNLGINVVSVLAGLGIGGLAIALAAQDTVGNLFGSITIIFDKPFQVGDLIKVSDTEGVVEEIGFRSTRIRTAYDSVVTMPNSTMAKEKIENLGSRKNLRVRTTLGLTYDTSEDQMKQYIDKLKYYLVQHPEIRSEDVIVQFSGLGDFSLQVLVNFFVKSVDPVKHLQIQQEFLFEAMKIANSQKIEFAFPTATHLVKTLPN